MSIDHPHSGSDTAVDLRALAARFSAAGETFYVALGKHRQPACLSNDKELAVQQAVGSQDHTKVWKNGERVDYLSTWIVLRSAAQSAAG